MGFRSKRIDGLIDNQFDRRYSLINIFGFLIGSKSCENNAFMLYRTRFMLDELGNLQSEGHGIENFQTMLSIGLGQEQQFT